MRFVALLGIIGFGLAGCNGAANDGTNTSTAVAQHSWDSTGTHIHSRVDPGTAQSVQPGAVYGNSGFGAGGGNAQSTGH